MSQLFVFVLQDPDQEQDLLSVLLEQGAPGVTIVDSYGMSHQHTNGRFDELPLMPSLSAILRTQEEPSLTFFTVLPDNFDVDGLIAATEEVLGDLKQPNVGVAFTMPVSRTWGMAKSRRNGEEAQ